MACCLIPPPVQAAIESEALAAHFAQVVTTDLWVGMIYSVNSKKIIYTITVSLCPKSSPISPNEFNSAPN